MSPPAVSIQGLGKRYRIMHQSDRYGRLSESLAGLVRAPLDRLRGRSGETAESFWALKDVTFDVEAGEVMGIVGRNGAGKSTLLKVLSRVTEPTEGRADILGRVSALLEVGTGFHPELTGRENIYLSGSILGMRRNETDRRFDDIVEFAGVEQFLDTPVKRYSSGMLVRLGFAVAAHLEPEVLIVDEVLAVGDASFQKRCLSKMQDVSREGRTILFVSHNMPAVEALCTRAALLDQGSLVATGPSSDVVQRYVEQSSSIAATDLATRPDRRGNGRFRFVSVNPAVKTGGESEIRLRFTSEPGLRSLDVSLALFTLRGEGAANLNTESTGFTFATVPREGTLVCRLPRAALMPGTYRMNVYATANGQLADWVIDAAVIEVSPGDFYGTGKLPPPGYGSALVPNEWQILGD